MILRTSILVAFMLALFRAVPAAAAPPPTLDLPWILDRVRQGNPDVKAAQAAIAGARDMVVAAHSLPDPEVGVEYWGIPRPGLDLGAANQRFLDFSQDIPFPGKTVLQSEVAEHEVHMKEAEAERVLQQKLFEGKQAYWDLYTAVASMDVLAKTERSLRGLVGLTQQRIRFSQGGRMDQLMEPMAQMEMVDLDNQRLNLLQERIEAKARLLSLMGLESGEALPDPPENLDLPVPDLDLARVLARALDGRPDMMEAYHHLLHMRAQRKLALSGWMPDLMLQYSLVDNVNGPGTAMAMAKVNLPFLWFWRQGAEVAAASREVDAAAAMLRSTRQETEAMASAEVSALQSLEAQWQNDRTRALPEAARALALGLSGYRSGSVGVADALSSVQAYVRVNLEGVALRAQIERTLSGIEQISGEDFVSLNAPKEMRHE